MIAYIKGKLIFTNKTTVIVSAGGLGYEIYYKNNFNSSDIGTEIELFIAQKSSQYSDTLFGFKTIEEKLLFEDLANITGLGTKLLYSIMSELSIKSYSQLCDLKLDDLTKIKGVGRKIAQKFLLGISTRSKLDLNYETQNKSVGYLSRFDGIIETLVGWGIKKTSLMDFISKNHDKISNLTDEKAIKFILKNVK